MATETASESQSSSKDNKDDQILKLSECINTIKKLWRHRKDKTSIDQYAEFYTSCVAYMCHLKLDQETLFKASHSTPQFEGRAGFITPLPNEIPAITALMNDVVLFQTFLSMLTPSKSLEDTKSAVSPAGTINNVKSSKVGQQSQIAIHGTKKSKGQILANKQQSMCNPRKRTLSYDLENNTPKKLPKHLYSPKQNLTSDRNKILPVPNLPLPVLSSSSNETYQLNNIGTPVLAATIFFSALRHLDHWPPILLKAFAVDSFGPRRWVDDERCKLFVKNLFTALEPNQTQNNIKTPGEQHDTVERFAKNYQRMLSVKPSLDRASPVKYEGIGSKSSFCSEEELSPKALVPSDTDSDSGEEECVVEVSSGNALSQMKKKASQMSSLSTKGSFTSGSSSGEEEMEEVVVSEAKVSISSTPEPKNGSNGTNKNSTTNNQTIKEKDSHESKSVHQRSEQSTKSNYWWHQKLFNLTPIRSRFVGELRSLAFTFVADALSKRLEAKTKQNSSLLSTLPSFIMVPKVRNFAAKHLERWLQSPALSGLSRVLFSSIVEQIENIDPPLQDDLETIDSILSMKLKANQLTVHTENIKTIVKKVPTESISRTIFLHLLREELNRLNANDPQSTGTSTQMRIFVDVHSSLPSQLAATALASAVLSLLCIPNQQNTEELPSTKKLSNLKKVQILTRNVATALGNKFNGFLLIKYILQDHKRMFDGSFEKSQAVECINPDDIARLVFECATLIVPLPTSLVSGNHRQQQKFQRKTDDNLYGDLSEEEAAEICRTLLRTRKCIMKWCLGTYVRLKATEDKKKGLTLMKREKGEKQKTNRKEKYDRCNDPLVGAGVPDYQSILDGETKASHYSNGSVPHNDFIKSIRCLLFLVKPDSKELWSFLNEDENFDNFDRDHLTTEQRYRIHVCTDHGGDIDDEMMQIILQAHHREDKYLSSFTIISLIEELFYHCRRGEKSQLKITDCKIVWLMYELAEYVPSVSLNPSKASRISDSDKKYNGVKRKRDEIRNESDIESEFSGEISRLAYPGIWWRVTSLILILSGMSPSIIGAAMWKEHPTVRALIKMITSGRYRFPTVDCDDTEQEKMKKEENKLREKEASITKFLFLPKSQQPSKKVRKDNSPPPIQSGSRTSARQRAKQERILSIQREKEKARIYAEEQRIKKLLRSAQKTIMIWDPRCSARKPPKDSVSLILSVAHLFDLSNLFRLCVEPDIVLQTIGSTSRGSIERAYDWLIPVISSHSKIINRLPPSASCFLLLRAYGTDKNQNSQLLELSSPLLSHVTDCLIGKFGEDGAQRAVDLLFVDLADFNPDRRRCARRVLQEVTAKMDTGLHGISSLHVDEFAWLFNLIEVKYAATILPTVISNISRALAYERGRVLCAYILALKHYIDFAHDKSIETSLNFSNILCELLSVRPHVCCAAMDRNPDLQNMAIDVVRKEVEACIDNNSRMMDGKLELSVEILLHKQIHVENHEKDKSTQTCKVIISLQLLRAAVVLISNWRDDCIEAKDTLLSLVNYLIPSDKKSSPGTENVTFGAASAIFIQNKKRAISVEQWVMLAKSRCHFIARNAALCTPDIFLPRLLLCCGLPRPSLVTMLERLGKLGDDMENQHKCFSQLLLPSATAEWGIGNIGKRSLITRKLLGRISAYLNTFGEKMTQIESEDITLKQVPSSSFVTWLVNECNTKEQMKKKRTKRVPSSSNTSKSRKCGSNRFTSSCSISSMLSQIVNDSSGAVKCKIKMEHTLSRVDSNNVTQFDSTKETIITPSTKSYQINCEVLEEWVCDRSFEQIESALKRKAESILIDRQFSCDDKLAANDSESVGPLLKTLLKVFRRFSFSQELKTILLKWFPVFSQYFTDHSVFDDLFQHDEIIDYRDVMESIILQCIKTWTPETILSCQLWVLTNVMQSKEIELYDLCLLLKFILLTSNQCPSQKKKKSAMNNQSTFLVLKSQDNLKACVALALKCAELRPSTLGDDSKQEQNLDDHDGNYTNRNLLPDWLEMLLVIGNCGKKYLSLMTKIIVEKIPPTNLQKSLLTGLLLRLYVHFPSTMNLSDSKTRGILIESVNFFSEEWIDWRTSLDNQLKLSIKYLEANPNQRQQQLLSDLAKRYPLLVVRELALFTRTLKRDATACYKTDIERRGRVNKLLDNQPIDAKTSYGMVKVSVTHWGYSFTEPLWISILEIMDSIPNEVLYACGIKMGLLQLLNLYISLIVVQMEVGVVSFTSTLKSKLSKILLTFQPSNKIEYDRWSASNLKELEGKGSISNMLKAYRIIGDSNFHDKKAALLS